MNSYYQITNKIFEMKNMSYWDYATLASISYANIPFVISQDDKVIVTEIETGYVSAETLIDTLKIGNDNRDKNRIRDKINESLTKLEKWGVIKIVDIKENSERKYYKIRQQISTKGEYNGFSSITVVEFERIIFGVKKTSDKVKALACYISIIHRIFKTDYNKFNSKNLSHYINWETQESIGDKYGVKRKSVSKTINLLVEVQAIATKTIKRKDKGKEIKNIYTKYCDRDKLDMYIKEQLNNKTYIERTNDYTIGAIDLKSKLFSK